MGAQCSSSNRVHPHGAVRPITNTVGLSVQSLRDDDELQVQTRPQNSNFQQQQCDEIGSQSAIIALPPENSDFTQQCYNLQSQLQLQTVDVKFADFTQQCYEGKSRPLSSKPVGRSTLSISNYERQQLQHTAYTSNDFEMMVTIAKELEELIERKFGVYNIGLGNRKLLGYVNV